MTKRKIDEKSLLLRWLHGRSGSFWGTDPTQWDAITVLRTLATVDPLFGPRRWFGLEMDGLDLLPEPPAMLVSNHSGGTSVVDVWGLAVGWYRHFGPQRPLRFTAHEMMLSNPVTGRFFGRLGVVRANREITREVLEHGHDTVIMPGGDQDVWRPHRDRFRLRFAGHTGYARLAIECGVPIVPLVHTGPHDTFYVISDGRRLARAVGLHRLARADVWPIHVSLPWGLGVGPWPHIPWPGRFRYRFGNVIRPPARLTDESVRELDCSVRAAMQAMLDEFAQAEAQ